MKRNENGELATGMMLLLTFAFMALVMLGVSIFLNAQLNANTAISVRETRNVARCSFQFSAYRAQYSGATNTALKPIKGLDPYAGLALPPAQVISKHLAANCQKYLVPFLSLAREGNSP